MYNIETAMPKIDLEVIETHLRAAREEERRVSKNIQKFMNLKKKVKEEGKKMRTIYAFCDWLTVYITTVVSSAWEYLLL